MRRTLRKIASAQGVELFLEEGRVRYTKDILTPEMEQAAKKAAKEAKRSRKSSSTERTRKHRAARTKEKKRADQDKNITIKHKARPLREKKMRPEDEPKDHWHEWRKEVTPDDSGDEAHWSPWYARSRLEREDKQLCSSYRTGLLPYGTLLAARAAIRSKMTASWRREHKARSLLEKKKKNKKMKMKKKTASGGRGGTRRQAPCQADPKARAGGSEQERDRQAQGEACPVRRRRRLRTRCMIGGRKCLATVVCKTATRKHHSNVVLSDSRLRPCLPPTHHRHHIMADQDLTAAAKGAPVDLSDAVAVQRTRVTPHRQSGMPPRYTENILTPKMEQAANKAAHQALQNGKSPPAGRQTKWRASRTKEKKRADRRTRLPSATRGCGSARPSSE